MIGVLGSLAEHERELIKERTALKRKASRSNGTKFGRPCKVPNAEHIATAKRMKADGHTGRDIAKHLGVSRAAETRPWSWAGISHAAPWFALRSISCLGGLLRRRRAGARIGIGDDIVNSIFDRF
jgi:DNA invertase Pin-like site-specific DNA recombinase